MKVHQLKDLLQDWIDMLDDYDDNQEVNMSCNTYGMGSTFVATYDGFIDMSNPVKGDEEDW